MTHLQVHFLADNLQMSERSARYKQQFDEWRTAEDAARGAEEEVAQRLLSSAENGQEPPRIAIWAEANALRKRADEALRRFVAAVEAERAEK
jgi:hypothetical protein